MLNGLFRGRHRWFEQNLDAYADGELAGDERRKLETHLESCGRCATRLGEVRELRSLLRAMPEVEAPRSFALTPAMVREPVKQKEPRRSMFGQMRAAPGIAAASMAVFVALVVVDVSGSGSGGLAPASEPEDIGALSAPSDGDDDAAIAEDAGPETASGPADQHPGEDESSPPAGDDENYYEGSASPTPEVSGAGSDALPTPAPTLDPDGGAARPEETPAAGAGTDGGGTDGAGTDDAVEDDLADEEPPAAENARDVDGDAAVAVRVAEQDDSDGGTDLLRVAQVAFGGLAVAAAAISAGGLLRSRRS